MNERLHIAIRGAVQGVGFRPFIYRLATEMELAGWVRNSPQGVFIEVEGGKSRLDAFVLRIEKERPPRSFIQSLEFSFLDPAGYSGFEIRRSESLGEATTLVLPDIAICPDCLREIFDPADRRHLYPFTNCTNCGPRFTIIESLPYDRASTSMRRFEMCGDCRREYETRWIAVSMPSPTPARGAVLAWSCGESGAMFSPRPMRRCSEWPVRSGWERSRL